MCNFNFDADREITSGTERKGQRQRTFYWDRGGVILSYFLSCNFYFLMFLLFSLLLLYNFCFLEGGCIILKEEKRCVLFDCVKVYLLPLSVSLLSPHLPRAVT